MSFIYRGGITRLIQRQSLAEHHYYVDMYAWQIAAMHPKGTDPDESSRFVNNVAFYSRWHDQPEGGSGDMPSPWKKALKINMPQVFAETYKRMEHEVLAYRFGYDIPEHIRMIERNYPEIIDIVKAADILEWVLTLCTDIQLGNGSLGDIERDSNWANIICLGSRKSVGIMRQHNISVSDFDSMLEADDHPDDGILIRNILWLAKAWSKLDFGDIAADEAWVQEVVPALMSHRFGISRQRY